VSTDLVDAICRAIELIETNKVNPLAFHNDIKDMYSWDNVAERTEKVGYRFISLAFGWESKAHTLHCGNLITQVYELMATTKQLPLVDRLRRYHGCGPVSGIAFCIVATVDFLLLCILDWLWPPGDIDPAL
jgi:phosphatidylinositol glycan class A protein